MLAYNIIIFYHYNIVNKLLVILNIIFTLIFWWLKVIYCLTIFV